MTSRQTVVDDVVVELAFGSGYATDPDAYVWTDVSDSIEAESAVSITRGRGDELSQVQPSRLQMTFDNRTGHFTPDNPAGAYYPDVKRGVPIRVSVEFEGETYHRFTGFVDQWPVTWSDGTDASSTVQITATDRAPRWWGSQNTLRALVTEEYLKDSPSACYTLGEAGGATSSVNQTPETQPNLEALGTARFGEFDGAVTDDLAGAGTSLYEVQATPGTLFSAAADPGLTLAIVASVTSAPTSGYADLVALRRSSALVTTVGDYRVSVDSSGYLVLRRQLVEYASTTTIDDGDVHLIGARETRTGGSAETELLVDGVVVFTTPTYTAPSADLTVLTLDGQNMPNAMVCHAAVFRDAVADDRVEAWVDAALHGFSGEASEERIARILTYAGVPLDSVDVEPGLSRDLFRQKTDGRTAAALLEEVVVTEGGLVFEDGAGVVQFHSRQHRTSVPAVVTLSATAQEVEADLSVQHDDFGMVNTCEVTSTNPAVAAARIVDQASVDEHGPYPQAITSLSNDPVELLDTATWLVARYSQPLSRVNTVSVQLGDLSDDKAAAVLGIEIGDRICLDALPSQAPASSLELLAEGYTEVIGSASYRLTFNTSPVAAYDAWRLDDEVWSVLGESTSLAY